MIPVERYGELELLSICDLSFTNSLIDLGGVSTSVVATISVSSEKKSNWSRYVSQLHVC